MDETEDHHSNASDCPAPGMPQLFAGSHRASAGDSDRYEKELEHFSNPEAIQDLPTIASYWAHRHLHPILEPLGFTNSIELFRGHSTEGFEGIRSQDILPLLVTHFSFELFVAFGNIIDPFIDRGFGPNFDPDNEWDRAFIDRVHALDVTELEAGRIKPTHMMAVMRKKPAERPRFHKHLTPEFCIRRP